MPTDKERKDAWQTVLLGFIIAVFAFVFFIMALGIGRGSVVDDCMAFGMFKESGIVYMCHRKDGS